MFITVKWRSFIRAVSGFTAACIMFAILGAIRTSEVPVRETLASAKEQKILIIDPGHGGLDGGAVGGNGAVESGINLDISLKLRDLALFFGEPVVMTRESEEIEYPDENATIGAKKVSDQHSRVELINSMPGATLISIHQNTYSSAQPRGAQVFYRETEESQRLAETIQAQLGNTLTDNNRRVAAPISKNIYLMKQVNCTAVLVECGFLSNPEECEMLSTDTYRTKLAMTILSGWFLSK